MRTKIFVGLLAIFLFFSGSAFGQIRVQQEQIVPDTDLQRETIIKFIENQPPEVVDRFYNLLRIISLIDQSYVEDKSVEEVFNLAMKGAVEGLDPYSHLFLNEEASMVARSLSGEEDYVSIGARVQVINKETVVMSVFDNSPAMAVGIEPGDIVTRIGGEDIWGWSTQEVVEAIRDQENTVVTLEVRSMNLQKPRILEVIRKKVVIVSVFYRNDLIDNVGYIKISTFTTETPDRFREALKALADEEYLVIDLRDNSGGQIKAVVKMISYMVGPDKLVISVKNGNPRFNIDNDIYTSDNQVLPSVLADSSRTVVLVNNFSASASEIMAGNLQYYDIATIVGIRTFGKASAQNYYDIDELSHAPENTSMVLVLTVAKWYLPDGKDVSKDGVSPDIETRQPESFRIYDYRTKNDAQLQAAVEFLKGKEDSTRWYEFKYLQFWRLF